MVQWNEVFHLQIRDPALRTRVEGFLNHFQNATFPYDFQDAATGRITRRELTGQEILTGIQRTLQTLSSATPEVRARYESLVRQAGFEFRNGRFTITDHNNPVLALNPGSGSSTIFFGNPPSIPLGIRIGTQYLSGAQYLGVDGRHHPVTVDGVLSHEMAHLAFLNPFETARPGQLSASQVEGIVVTALGGVQRDDSTHIVRYTPGSNGGYQTLYDRPGRRGSLELYRTTTDVADLSEGTGQPLRLGALTAPQGANLSA